MSIKSNSHYSVLIASLAILFTGCGPSEPVTYRVPAESRPTPSHDAVHEPRHTSAPTYAEQQDRETQAPTVQGPMMTPGSSRNMQVLPGMVEGVAAFPTPGWQAPEHWQENDPGPVRRGSFEITNDQGAYADFAITVFPGDVGGVLPNINRWRDQLRLPAISPADLPNATEEITVGGRPGLIMMIEGNVTGGSRNVTQTTLGAFVFQEDSTWFFKMTGDDDLVRAEETPFRAFLDTVSFQSY